MWSILAGHTQGDKQIKPGALLVSSCWSCQKAGHQRGHSAQWFCHNRKTCAQYSLKRKHSGRFELLFKVAQGLKRRWHSSVCGGRSRQNSWIRHHKTGGSWFLVAIDMLFKSLYLHSCADRTLSICVQIITLTTLFIMLIIREKSMDTSTTLDSYPSSPSWPSFLYVRFWENQTKHVSITQSIQSMRPKT